jgi:hypothetical protein
LGLPFTGLIANLHQAQQGVYHPDQTYLDLEQIWILVDDADLTVMLDQPIHSYEHAANYQSLISLARFKQRSKPVIIEGYNDPKIWLTDLKDNDRVLEYISQSNLHDTNLVLRLYEVYDLDLFQRQIHRLDGILTDMRCRWVCYRASPHEDLHFEATQILLQHPEFVLLNPAVFEGDVSANIQQKIYHHWIQLYL